MQQMTGVVYLPSFVIADGAKAITLVVKNMFGATCNRAMCWAHVYRNVQQHLVGMDSDLKDSVLRGLEVLQLAPTMIEFQMVVRLFLEWLDGHPQLEVFKDYFSTQWLGDLQGWYEGFTGCYPSMNNGLEAVNGTLKASYTLRDRLPLPRFLQLTKKVMDE